VAQLVDILLLYRRYRGGDVLNYLKIAVSILAIIFITKNSFADDFGVGLLSDDSYQPSYLISQLDGSDAYDPFVDYSEFDEASDEEADINFFKHGRFFTIGLTFGNRFVTSRLKEVYSDSLSFGLFISYFFDLRFALQMGFVSGSNHRINIAFPSGQKGTGTTSISTINLGLKYYFNTQNVTKGLAQFNPYMTGGFSMVTRKTNLDNLPDISEDSATGMELGAGIEFPLLRKKMFVGFQLTYLFVTFSDENQIITAANAESSGIRPEGDLINALAILGINF